MVDARMGADLLSFGVKVLVLGDPAQLPPVGGAGYFTENVKPDIMLEEIHRQAEESPIIRLATQARKEQPLTIGDYGSGCRVVSGEKIDPDEALRFDQILVGKNKTRYATNRRVRTLKGIDDPYPVIGDRLVCLRNDHEAGLLNGALFNVNSVGGVMDHKVMMDIVPEGSPFAQSVMAHEHYFLGKGDDLPWFERKEAQEFDYGYALTVHKAQGSQWNSVLLCDESFVFRKDRWRWLYTGITRAAEKLTVVRM
jgi:exodeoxyribonuclease-5